MATGAADSAGSGSVVVGVGAVVVVAFGVEVVVFFAAVSVDEGDGFGVVAIEPWTIRLDARQT